MKKFYLNDREINVEISPILAETLDESLDNMTISLQANSIEKPYAALVNVIKVTNVDENQNETIIGKYIIAGDNVEIMTLNPKRYKHTLSLIQLSQFLTKKEIRNTVFSTSLEGATFTKYASATSYALMYGDDFQSGDCTISGFRYISNKNIEAVIDLSKKTIVGVKGKFSFNTQYVYKATKSGRVNGYIYCEYREPSNFKDAYINALGHPDTLPTLVFDIDGETRELTLNADDVLNGDSFIIPNTILDWIKSFSSGTLTIYIKAAPNNGTFMILDYFRRVNFMNHNMLFNVSFEFQFTSVDDKNVYNVIQTLLNQQLKETKDYNRTNDTTIVPLFEMPSEEHNPDLYDLLTKTSAPNFVFTQGNMYEALVEIFKLFDAIFTIDNDGYLDIEYYNDHKQIVVGDNLKAGRQSSLGEERFANRLISYYQNTKINDRFPNSNQENALAYLRSKTLGVPSQDDFVFMLPKPIDYLLNVKISCSFKYSNPTLGALYYGYYVYFGNPLENNKLLDITNLVVEAGIWSLLPNNNVPINGDWQIHGKKNCLSFTRGTNYIAVSDYYKGQGGISEGTQNQILGNVIATAINLTLGIGGSASVTVATYTQIPWNSVKLAVSYIALTDGKVVNESIDYKYDGGILINQNNGSIDINKLGLNMVGLSLKLGQPTLTMTQKITRWEDRIKKGEFFIQDNERWVANTCSYTFINSDLIEATIEFVKNFNGLASRIELNNEKRLSNISNELTVKCEENYGEYIYYGTNINISSGGEKIVLNDIFLINSLMMGFGGVANRINSDTHYDASNKIVDTTLAAFNPSNYSKKQLVRLTGYVINDISTDNPSGSLVLGDDYNNPVKTINIPLASTDKISIFYNEITGEFNVDYNYFDNYDQQEVDPFNYIREGDEIEVLLIVNGEYIEGAVVTDDRDIVGLTGWFNPEDMISAVPTNDYKIEYASLTALDENGNVIKEDEYSTDNLAIPLVVYGSGNSICFEMSFDSPISAGTKLMQDSVLWTGGWFSSAILYTNKSGEATKFTIDFVMLQEELTRQFPKLIKNNGDALPTYSFGKIEELAYYKKPNEIFALNYQLHFLPYGDLQDCFLTNEYIKNNGFANGLNKKILKIVYTTNEDSDEDKAFRYSILDTKGYGSHEVEITSVSTAQYIGAKGCSIFFNNELSAADIQNILIWAVVDEDNNIYFASNNAPSSGFHVDFLWRHHRKEI